MTELEDRLQKLVWDLSSDRARLQHDLKLALRRPTAEMTAKILALPRIRPSELKGDEAYNRNGEYVYLPDVLASLGVQLTRKRGVMIGPDDGDWAPPDPD